MENNTSRTWLGIAAAVVPFIAIFAYIIATAL